MVYEPESVLRADELNHRDDRGPWKMPGEQPSYPKEKTHLFRQQSTQRWNTCMDCSFGVSHSIHGLTMEETDAIKDAAKEAEL